MLPAALIAQYWHNVAEILTTVHHLTAADAASAVRAHRQLLDERGIGDIAYNRDAEYAAESVAAGWKSGFLKRQPARTP
jgi:hypothetical protein